VLGHRYSGLVAIQPRHALATTGLYGVICHPSYLGLLVNSLGSFTACLVPPLIARIRPEERLLGSQFGREYEVYCNRTSRLIPGVY
jgi:protein-S-isoprenylcysteine O-methyltransferase Ste14